MRITLQEDGNVTTLTLEGRVAGPWAEELSRFWQEKASQLARKKLMIDICNVIYADEDGMRVLREIHSQSGGEVLANTPWTQHLAREIAGEAEILS